MAHMSVKTSLSHFQEAAGLAH